MKASKALMVLIFPLLATVILVLLLNPTSASTLNSEAPMWGNAINISANDGSSGYSQVILDDLGNVHIIWRDNSLYPYDTRVFYRVRSPYGVWSPISVVPDSQVDVGVPDAATDLSGTIHLVWRTPSSILYAYKPATATWSVPITISAQGSPNDPDIETGPDGTLHVMWGHGTYRERTRDGSWLDETMVFTGVYNQGPVDIAVSNDGVVHAVIGDVNTGDIYYSCHAPGEPWTIPFNVSNNPTHSDVPLVSTDANGGVHIVWRDAGGPNNNDIFYRARITGAWTVAKNISNIPGDSYRQRLAVAPDGAVHVVWTETGMGVSGCYYTSKLPGDEWTPPEQVDYGGCEIAVAESGDVHWLWKSSSTLYHWWRVPPSTWSSRAVYTVDSLSYINLSAGPDHSLHAVWSGKPSYTGDLDVFYASFYQVAVSTIIPTVFTNSYSTNLTIYGSGFLSKPQIYLGQTQLISVMFGSTSDLTAQVPPGFPAGWYTVTVINPDGVYGASTQFVMVRNPIPTVNRVSPTETFNLASTVLDVFGENFVPTPTVFLDLQMLTDVQWLDSMHLSVNVPTVVVPGWYSLTVVNPGPGMPSSTLSNALRIKPPFHVFLPLVLKLK